MSSLKNKIWGVGLAILGYLFFSFLTTSKCTGNNCWLYSIAGFALGFIFIAGGLIIYSTPSKKELEEKEGKK